MNKEELAKLTADPKKFVEDLKNQHTAELTAKDEESLALTAQHTAELTAKDEEISSLKSEMVDLAKGDNRGIVSGEFKSEDGKIYGFKRGFTKITFQNETINSEDLFKKENASKMERLIEIGFGGLEVIKSSKK